MNPRIRPWTAEEDLTALAMRRDGARPPAIADALRRTRGAVSSRLKYLGLAPEERLQKNQAKCDGRTKRAQGVVRERITPSNNKFVPPAVLEERERRVMATRTITETLFGDPVFHRSALGKKTAGVST